MITHDVHASVEVVYSGMVTALLCVRDTISLAKKAHLFETSLRAAVTVGYKPGQSRQ
jgi:hypothetical protein